jgi:hypothetical protein
MNSAEINDPHFRAAVDAIDHGDLQALNALLVDHPELLTDPLDRPSGDYFQNPHLLWFLADNPIRTGQVAENILELADSLIRHARLEEVPNLRDQLDYTFALVATGGTVRDAEVQIPLMELLIAAGATPSGSLSSICHGNPEAAAFLLDQGEPLTLPVAAALGYADDLPRLAAAATPEEKHLALTAAAFTGRAEEVRALLALGADPNGYPVSPQFHRHATALHQAISAASLDAVEALLAAGADRDALDKGFQGTPLDWANHFLSDPDCPHPRETYEAIIERLTRDSG